MEIKNRKFRLSVVISIIFVIVVLLVISNEYRYSNLSAEFFAATLFFTSPCWLYWASFWIWGEGFIRRLMCFLRNYIFNKKTLSLVGKIWWYSFLLFALIVGKILGIMVYDSMKETKTESTLESALVKTSKEINKKAPYAVDDITILEESSAYGKRLSYYYKINTKISDTMAAGFEKKMKAILRKQVCEKKEMISILRSGGSFLYHYKDNENSIVLIEILTYNDCKQYLH